MSSKQVTSPEARRASVQTSDVYTCVIHTCSLPTTKKGGYCLTHANQFAVATQGVVSPPASDVKGAEQICFGHSCQGQIKAGYCSRHRQLANLGDIQGDLSLQYTPTPSHKKQTSSTLVGSSSHSVLQVFLDGLHNIYRSIEPHLAAEAIIRECCTILSAERATLFYVDGDELVLMIAKGAKNIRLPRSRGIAGHVSLTGATVNIPDAYKEEKFDSTFDASTGFRTRNILATPVQDQDGKVIAVLQVINKLARGPKTAEPGRSDSYDAAAAGDSFTDEDVTLLESLAFHVGVALRNAQQYEQVRRSEAKVSSLLEIIQMLHSDPSFNSLIFTLTTRSPALVDADRCTLYMVDYPREQLVVMTGDVDIRIPLNKGLAGATATEGKIINIPDCYADERFNTEVDKKTGYRTKSMLCMPIPGELEGDALRNMATAEEDEEDAANNNNNNNNKPPVIGVLQLINRNDEQPFSSEDESILSTLLSIAGPILQKYSIFKPVKPGANIEKAVLDTPLNKSPLSKSPLSKSPLSGGRKLTGSPTTKTQSFKPSLSGSLKEGPE